MSVRTTIALMALLLGFLLYLGFRTPETLSNRLFLGLVGWDNFSASRLWIQENLALPADLQGCLPSALWVCLLTAVMGDYRSLLGWVPLLAGAFWEGVQWFGWTDGRADWRDLLASVVGGLIFLWLMPPLRLADLPSNHRKGRLLLACGAFASMAMADVIR